MFIIKKNASVKLLFSSLNATDLNNLCDHTLALCKVMEFSNRVLGFSIRAYFEVLDLDPSQQLACPVAIPFWDGCLLYEKSLVKWGKETKKHLKYSD